MKKLAKELGNSDVSDAEAKNTIMKISKDLNILKSQSCSYLNLSKPSGN